MNCAPTSIFLLPQYLINLHNLAPTGAASLRLPGGEGNSPAVLIEAVLKHLDTG